MDDTTTGTRKKVLLVEDEPEIIKCIETLFAPYEDLLELDIAQTAEQALEKLYKNETALAFDALILDIMLPYGSNRICTQIKGEADMAEELETGIQLLQYIREKEAESGVSTMWVSVITGRNAPQVLRRINDFFKGYGRLLVKPFNDFVLENDIAHVLGIESNVPEILLPEGYEVPKPVEVTYGA